MTAPDSPADSPAGSTASSTAGSVADSAGDWSATRPRPGFVVVAAAFLVTMIGTTLPTPLYPIYESDFGWSRLTVTVVFATYAVGVLSALVLLGNVSDRVGRIRTLVPGLVAAGLSALCFLLAPDLGVALVGRFLSGVSAGIFTGTATATLLDLTPPAGRQRAALIATVVNMGGLGLGPPLAGIAAELLPYPLRTVYLLHLLLVILTGVVLARVVEPTDAHGPFRLRPRGLTVPASTRAEFLRAGVAGFAGFAVLGLFTAITPSLLGEIVGVTNHAGVGAVVMLMFLGSVVGQLLRRRVGDRVALAGGCAVLIVGMALLVLAVHTGSLLVLVATALVSGAGQGLSFAAALGLVVTEAPEDQRAAVTSSLFLVVYVAISLPVVGVGLLARAIGLVDTGTVFAVLVAVLAAAAATSLALDRRTADQAR